MLNVFLQGHSCHINMHYHKYVMVNRGLAVDERRPRVLHQLGGRTAIGCEWNEQRRVLGAVLLQRTMERYSMRQWEWIYMHAGAM